MISHLIIALSTLSLLVSATPIVTTGLSERSTHQLIQSTDTHQCLSLPQDQDAANGGILVMRKCDEATHWDVEPYAGGPQGGIKISPGGEFALDAGEADGDDSHAVQIWVSVPGSPRQTYVPFTLVNQALTERWVVTQDHKIAIWNGNQCLQHPPGPVQVSPCDGNRAYQQWNIIDDPPAPTPSPSTTIPPAPMPTPLAQVSRQGQCATVVGIPNIGLPVSMSPCLSQTDPAIRSQLWSVQDGEYIRLSGTEWCLDAGEIPANGGGLKLWTCDEGLAQQQWSKGQGEGQVRTINGAYLSRRDRGLSVDQCLNVDSADESRLQTWECSNNGDPQEQFAITYGDGGAGGSSTIITSPPVGTFTATRF